MKIGTKIVLAALAAVGLTTVTSLVVQRGVIRKQGIQQTRDTMRAALLEAENVRDSVAGMASAGAFDYPRMLAEKQNATILQDTAIYKTVPVVSAWRAIEKVAAAQGYEFRIAKFQPRNPKNMPSPAEAEILKKFESGGLTEYFEVNEARNQILYARPIRLTADCLTCHGDPANSPTHDGRDMVGLQMENWHAGEVHGTFILKASLDSVDKVAQAGMNSTLLYTIPVALLLGALFFFGTGRLIVKPLKGAIAAIRQVSEETASASSQIADASMSLASSASEQAASLGETGAALEQMRGSTNATVDHTQRASELARLSRTTAEQGSGDMTDLAGAMTGIQEAANNVSRIIKTIDEIAFQTNLLALNAAVEAARAGEAGAGFAVVADEVRNLSRRCAESAAETTNLIGTALERTEEGAKLTGKVTSRLGEIVSLNRKVNEAVAQIAAAAEEQRKGISLVNTSMTGISGVTQALSANAEQSAASTQELNEQTRRIEDSVKTLDLLVGAAD